MKYSYRISRLKVRIGRIIQKLKRYKTLFSLVLGTLIAYLLIKSKELIFALKFYGYFGAFIGGIAIPFGWTAIPAFAILFVLGKKLDVWIITSIALTGAVISNSFLLYWIKSILLRDVEFLQKLKKWIWLTTVRSELRGLVKSRYSFYIIPTLAGIIFASPLPNHWGIVLLALSGHRVRAILLPILLFSFVEIFLVVSLGRILS